MLIKKESNDKKLNVSKRISSKIYFCEKKNERLKMNIENELRRISEILESFKFEII